MPLVTWADAYPSKPIEWVVPYAAGGGTDVVARVLSEPMGKALGQSIIVVNKPGAATNIGADAVARAKPDGYTILTGDTGTLAANPYLYKNSATAQKKTSRQWGFWCAFPCCWWSTASCRSTTMLNLWNGPSSRPKVFPMARLVQAAHTISPLSCCARKVA